MGFFSKNKNKKELAVDGRNSPTLPELPPVPEFPEDKGFGKLNLPSMNSSRTQTAIPSQTTGQLPSFPSSQMGQRMNQTRIKEAVGEDYGEEEEEYIPTFGKPLGQVSKVQEAGNIGSRITPIISPIKKEKTSVMEMSEWAPSQIAPITTTVSTVNLQKPSAVAKTEVPEAIKIRKMEPIYIKLDKFESTMGTFNEIKIKVSEIESLLKEIRKIKLQEEKELNEWEEELESMKARLDQIDQQIFKEI